MDPLSHAIVGGTAAALTCRKSAALPAAVLCGVIAGMSPDLDVLIRAENNPIFGLKYHRFFTHALAFAPIGALLIAMFLWRWLRTKISFKYIYLFCFAGIAMHGILDSMTNYGTHLFWPFTNHRESWNIISIIDPIFTLTLLTLLILTVSLRKQKFALIGAIFAVSYWSLGLYQREQATNAMLELANQRGHVVERFEVKPSFANLLVWRAQYLREGEIYYDAFHTSPWRGQVVYAGDKLALFTPPQDISEIQRQDLDYFTFFSDGWLAYSPNDNNLIGDIRFSMLPNQSGPIWGIRLQADKPDSHILFENIRTRNEGDVALFWKMIKGEQ